MRTITRRRLLQTMGVGAAGAAFALTMSGCSAPGTTLESSSNAQQGSGTGSNTSPTTLATVDLGPGRLLGFVQNGVSTFRGIPYATAQRFQNPVAIDSYDGGTRNCMIYGPVAPQNRTLAATASVNPYEFFTPTCGTADMVGNEQCQYLNVWSHDLSGSNPVIVFFHGGGLVNGASSELSFYDGQYFARAHDVVFVSVNTRLNVLGFLDLSDYGEQFAESGIAGMKDAVMALQWVRDNIASFGGDPGNVTILGQSGGGQKVTTLASMAETQDLFSKVVMMSGYYATQGRDAALENTQLLVSSLGLSRGQVANTLSTMPYEQLYEAATNANCTWDTHYGTGTFEQPFIDAQSGSVNQYAAQRTWMIGNAYSEFNSNEMAWFASNVQEIPNSVLSDVSDDDARTALQQLLGSDTEEFISEYQNAYPGHALVESLWMSQGSTGIARYALTNPNTGAITLMNNAGIPVYNYVSAYRMPVFGGVTMAHSGDIGFAFDSIDTAPYLIAGDEDNAHKVADAMSSALAAFARAGNPSVDGLTWDAYDSQNHNTMVFDVDSQVRTGHDDRLYEIIQAHPAASM
ncbi:MAG: carboxylesterase family protein [Atopobiaceae bacterium]